ncbi:hypothetical protein MKY41_19185 [Sporosarcina sp. FSL W7-1349]|uniref:hypothetical protein n=1 Tax=Sporosarcina sp. FSL W7-1349 TaxID=2921561 RepID=UPI0030FB2E52
MMKTCTACHKKIGGEPFLAGTGNCRYCSMDCLPEGVMDEPYGLAYVGLLERYMDLSSKPWKFESFTERDAVLEEIDELAGQCAVYVLVEDGVHFFKDELRWLHGLIASLRLSVANHFLDVENYIYTDGLHISWDEMPRTIAEKLEVILQTMLDTEQWKPFISYNQSLDATTESRNVLTFPENEYEDKPELDLLYEASICFLKNEQQSLANEIDDAVKFVKMATCPVCTWPEPFEDFDLNEEFDAYVCGSCIGKRRSEFL